MNEYRFLSHFTTFFSLLLKRLRQYFCIQEPTCIYCGKTVPFSDELPTGLGGDALTQAFYWSQISDLVVSPSYYLRLLWLPKIAPTGSNLEAVQSLINHLTEDLGAQAQTVEKQWGNPSFIGCRGKL